MVETIERKFSTCMIHVASPNYSQHTISLVPGACLIVYKIIKGINSFNFLGEALSNTNLRNGLARKVLERKPFLYFTR